MVGVHGESLWDLTVEGAHTFFVGAGHGSSTTADSAPQIAEHAFANHAGEFPFLTNGDEFAATADNIIHNAVVSRPVREGVKAYWNDAAQASVIVNNHNPELSTMFSATEDAFWRLR
jgi:hypothetical protein